MCEGRLWQSMQSILRLSALSICSCVGGVSLVTNSTTLPLLSSIRTHGMTCRCSSVAMYVMWLAMFMCQ